jgi:NADH/F420H2 dehydrogenase subunit C
MKSLVLPGDAADILKARFPESAISVSAFGVYVAADHLIEVCEFLRDDPEQAFNYLTSVTAVDFIEEDYLEVVYHLVSIAKGTLLVLKVRTADRDEPIVPSVIDVWRTAEFQEREIYDLFGIRFAGHPDLRRIFLWDEFKGYPLRKDFLPLSQ